MITLRNLHFDNGVHFEPFLVIAVVKDIKSICTVYVNVSKFFFKFVTLQTAVSFCCQALKVLQKRSPAISSHVWKFLECAIFNFPKDNVDSTVLAALQMIK